MSFYYFMILWGSNPPVNMINFYYRNYLEIMIKISAIAYLFDQKATPKAT